MEPDEHDSNQDLFAGRLELVPNQEILSQLGGFLDVTPQGVLTGLRQLSTWLTGLSDSETLNRNIPLTGKNVGQTLDWGTGLADSIVDRLERIRLVAGDQVSLVGGRATDLPQRRNFVLGRPGLRTDDRRRAVEDRAGIGYRQRSGCGSKSTRTKTDWRSAC